MLGQSPPAKAWLQLTPATVESSRSSREVSVPGFNLFE